MGKAKRPEPADTVAVAHGASTPKGRIRPTYLLDAAMQTGWITAWLRSAPGMSTSNARRDER
jgi:hypothetical protein